MECFNAPEIKQLEKVLDHCGGSGDCDKCDFNWMEEHGIACYREVAKASMYYIKALKELVEAYDSDVDKLLEVIKNG